MTIETKSKLNEALAWEALADVMDPEIPVISVVDLGIINSISVAEGVASVSITPTYMACVAAEIMRRDISTALRKSGFRSEQVTIRHSPSWTSDRMTLEGRSKLQAYGIAPPSDRANRDTLPECPQCESSSTNLLSPFGSSACKALYKCDACGEAFERFKCK